MKSVVSYPDRGAGGKNLYRGNCSPRLIEDLIEQYKLRYLSDYMVGGGTTEDVCKAKQVAGTYRDLNRGFDLMSMDIPDRPENIFWHPPYGGMIIYSDNMYKAQDIIDRYGFDPRNSDLSRSRDWEEFVARMNYCCLKQFCSLEKGGRMFVLMGDWKQKGRLYSMLSDIVKPGTLEQIIIKMQHNCMSDSRSYSGKNFVPIVHEYCMVVKKDAALIIPVSMPRNCKLDMRDSRNTTWRDVIAAVLEEKGKPMNLSELYLAIGGHKKCDTNQHWKAKIRQTLRSWEGFVSVSDDRWSLAAA